MGGDSAKIVIGRQPMDAPGEPACPGRIASGSSIQAKKVE
jgi:hypothetical protein